MGRILVVEPDENSAQALARILRGTGHRAEFVADELSALAALMEEPADVLFSAAGPGAALARKVWSAVEAIEPAPRIIWMASARGMVLPMLEASRGDDFLEMPPSGDAVRALINTGMADGDGISGWSGLDFLRRVKGPSKTFPVARVMFLIHRVQGSGLLKVTGSQGNTWSVRFSKGQLVDCTGIGELLSEQGPVASADAPALMTTIGASIGQGLTPDRAMHAAGVGIARMAIRSAMSDDDEVVFEESDAASGAMRLPDSIPRLIGEAARLEQSAGDLRSSLGAKRKEPVRIRVPTDAPESKWGLPPVALRLIRDGSRVETLGELLGAARGGETDEVWEAIGILRFLGILKIGGAGAHQNMIVETPVDEIVVEPIDPDAEEKLDDPEAQELQTWLSAQDAVPAWQTLEIDDSENMTSDGVEAAFRQMSARFHPDRYLQSSDEARRWARRCFSRIAVAKEALADVDVLLEARQRMRAREEGRPYASDREKQMARLTAKRAEVAARKKQWDEAHRLWNQAVETDPTEIAYQWFALESGWRADKIAGPEAEAAMLELKGMKLGHRADMLAVVGDIRLRAGDKAGGYKAFEQVLEINPDHVGARRRLRLRDMRTAKEDAAKPRGMSLKSLFSRKQ